MSDSENYVAELHQDRDEARKRALDAEQAVRRVAEAYKAAADRLRSDLVQRTSERDAAREELKSLRYNLMAVTTQEKDRTDQLAMAEAACRRDATALGVLQTELDSLKAAHAWIKTSERMPEPEVVVLVVSTEHYANGEVCTANCYTSVSGDLLWECYCAEPGVAGVDIPSPYVTHWQPLPEPPK